MQISNLSGEDICERFLDEQSRIIRFIEYLEAEISSSGYMLRHVAEILTKHRIAAQLEPRVKKVAMGAASLVEEIRLVADLNELDSAIANTLRQARENLRSRSNSPENVEITADVDEWARYFINELQEDQSKRLIEAVRQQAIDNLRTNSRESETRSASNPEALIDEALSTALAYLAQTTVEELELVQEIIKSYDLKIQMKMPERDIHVFRQGFLLAMTAFDAAIFDLARLLLARRFFQLIGKFGGTQKVSIQSFSNHRDFVSFRDEIIEEQLRTKYLKELLQILAELGAPLTDPSSSDGFSRLIELVLRRNIHVHNRGIVDERYLDRDQNVKARFNVFRLEVGQSAIIDGAYWRMANSLTKYAVTHLSQWD